MSTNYPTRALMDYLPKRYSATAQQQADRNEVYRFKRGNFSSRVLNGLEAEINKITRFDKGGYLICFIPASTAEKTRIRFESLARRISEATGCKASITAISNLYDRQSTIVTGKTSDPTASFCFDADEVRNKKIILIDDVITRGRSFNGCAAKLMTAGAAGVEGLFVARTINPDYSGYGVGYEFDPEDFYEDEFDPMDYEPDFDDEPDPADYYEPDPEDFDELDPADYYEGEFY